MNTSGTPEAMPVEDPAAVGRDGTSVLPIPRWRSRIYWICFLLAPAAAFAIGFLAGPSTRPAGDGRVIETEFGPLLWMPLKGMLVGSWLGIWILGTWASLGRRSLPDIFSHLALAALGTLVLTPVGFFAGLNFNGRDWMRIAVSPRIELTDDMGCSWVVEGEGLQDPDWEIRRTLQDGIWTVKTELLGRVSVDEYERGVPVLNPEPGRILETHPLRGGKVVLLRDGGLAVFTSTGDCSFAYDRGCDKAWGVDLNGPAGAGFPPFHALLGTSDEPGTEDSVALLDRVRRAVNEGRSAMEDGIERSGTVPSDEAVAAALGHGNPRVRDLAVRILKLGGPSFYPESAKRAAGSAPKAPDEEPR